MPQVRAQPLRLFNGWGKARTRGLAQTETATQRQGGAMPHIRRQSRAGMLLTNDRRKKSHHLLRGVRRGAAEKNQLEQLPLLRIIDTFLFAPLLSFSNTQHTCDFEFVS
jgi:hypothetical protein